MNPFSIPASEFTLQPSVITEIFGIPFSSAMATGVLITLLVLIFGIIANRHIVVNGVPTKFQLALEFVYSSMNNLVGQIAGSTENAKKIIPIVLSVFLYIAIANTLLIIPVLGSLQIDGVYVFKTSTSDLNITFGLAATVVIWTHISSIKQFNLWNHFNKFIRLKSLWQGLKKGPGQFAMSVIDFFLGFLDIISEFAKSLSLSLRLFGNMFAGEVLFSLLMSLFAIIAPVALMFMTIFTGVLQALVFGALTAAYFGTALSKE